MKDFVKKYGKAIFKLKILDWLVILIVGGIILFFVISSLIQNQWISIEFKVALTPTYFPYNGEGVPPYWISEKIKPGDIQYDGFGQKNLEIKTVRSWGVNYQEAWVTALVKAKYNSRQKKYSFQYQPLEVGKSIDITVKGTSIHGIVTYIQGSYDTRKTYDVTVKTRLIENNAPYSAMTRGVDPWYGDVVDVGQVMKDTSGKIVAEILDKEVKPAERVVTSSDGRIFTGEDPLKKDIFLTIRVKTIKQNDSYFFLEDKPIKVGWQIPIILDKASLYPTIIQIL